MIVNGFFQRVCLLPGLFVLVVMLSGCATMPGWIPASGPSREQVQDVEDSDSLAGIRLVNVDDALTKKLLAGYKQDSFAEVFGSFGYPTYRVGPGDVIEISIWEAPPAMLFGSISMVAATVSVSNTQAATLPPQMIMEDGKITVPFAGRIPVAGRTVRAIETDIAGRLQGQANKPQVIVRIAQSNTLNVTVIGDTAQSRQVPLTPKGERLLDVIAAVGGVTQPVSRMAVQISREAATAIMPLESVIRDPGQNITLMPGDVITARHQPKSFAVFGAAGRSQEFPFEVQGISLAQALARTGGLNDSRADARGVFVFRFEDAALVSNEDPDKPLQVADNGTVPVVYQVNLRDPAAFFVTQNFPMQDQDLIYVANAPGEELRKFLSMIGAVLSPGMSTTNFVNNMSN